MSERVIVVIQARMTSTRLPGKVMLPLCGAPLVQRVIERAKRIPGTNGVCLAVPPGDMHAPLHDVAKQHDVEIVVGPEDDVLARYVIAADQTRADIVMRVTSDCPFIDPLVCADVLSEMRKKAVGCARTSPDSGYPLGLDTEVMQVEYLRLAASETQKPYDREHVAPYVWDHPERFPVAILDRKPDRRKWRLTVDTAADYELAKAIYDALWPSDPNFGFAAIERLLLDRPEILAINSPGEAAGVGRRANA